MSFRRIALILALALLLWGLSGVAVAQVETEITPTVSWMVGGKASTTGGGTVKYDNGAAFGIIAGERVETHVVVELSYTVLPTKGHFDPVPGSLASAATEQMTIHYVQFGAAYHALTEKVQPFLSTAWGLSWFRPGRSGISGDWRLAISAALGVKFFPAPGFGIRLQSRILMPVYFSRGGFWSSIAGGDARFRAGFPIIQADFGVGIVAAF